MPKIGLVGTSDISWGMSTFSRISRVDPATDITLYQVNARTVPYSGANVYSSSVAGALDEFRTSAPGFFASGQAQISSIGVKVSGTIASGLAQISSIGVAVSGVIASSLRQTSSIGMAVSGIVLSNMMSVSTVAATKLGVPLPSGSGWRMDAGTTGFSGWVKYAVSTGISSIYHAWTSPVVVSGDWNTSGTGFIPAHSLSGHCLDLYKFHAISGAAWGSSGTSSKVAWGVFGI